MTTNWFMIGIILVLFLVVMIIFSIEKLDYLPYSILTAIIACILTSIVHGATLSDFLAEIEFEPLIFIFGMQIIVSITEEYKIFQWVSVKTIRLTKGNHRLFFYLICIVSTLMAAIIADVTVAIIFVPLVIRACRVLNIEPAPYLFGITITINIGSIMTPFSSSENVLISSVFDLSFVWFSTRLMLFSVGAMIITLILLDIMILSKINPPEEQRKRVFMEIINPSLVIIDQKKFRKNSVLFILIIVGFILFSQFSYLIALTGGISMAILNRIELEKTIRNIDWKLIFFFISLFLLIGTLRLNGLFAEIANLLQKVNLDQTLFIAFGVLIIVSLMSGFLANGPTAIVGIQVISDLFGETVTEIPDVILIAFLLAINLGGNILPQGAACDVMTLNIATENKVKGFTYKTLLKRGGTFAIIHIGLCLIYITLFYYINLFV